MRNKKKHIAKNTDNAINIEKNILLIYLKYFVSRKLKSLISRLYFFVKKLTNSTITIAAGISINPCCLINTVEKTIT